MKIKHLLLLMLLGIAFMAPATVVQLYYGPDKEGLWAVYFFNGSRMYNFRKLSWGTPHSGTITFPTTIARIGGEELMLMMDESTFKSKNHPHPERVNEDGSFVYRYTFKDKLDQFYTFSPDFSILTITDSVSGSSERLGLYTYFVYLEAGKHYNVGPEDKRPGDIRTAAKALALRKGLIRDYAAEVDSSEIIPYDDSAPALLMPQLDKQLLATDSLQVIHHTTAVNAAKIPQEMVYLHLDNTSYYRGDSIFFAGYLVQAQNKGTVTIGKTTVATDEKGRGRINILPDSTRCRASVVIGKQTFLCDLPDVADEGVALHVDNFSSADSVFVSVARTEAFPIEAVGLTLCCRGVPYGAATIELDKSPSAVTGFARAEMPTGVMQLTLFAPNGAVLSDRLFFNNRNDFINNEYEFDNEEYGPCAPVEMTFTLPIFTQFSLSVTDADNELPYSSNIMADLLLASEIKGYVHNPAWYFEQPGDSVRQRSLDNLLMVQGWRKYSWEQLTGLKPYRVDFLPEKGIEFLGRVVGRWSNRPKKDVDVLAWIGSPRNPELHKKTIYTDGFRTDNEGRFNFRTDLSDTWNMTLGVGKKGKPRTHHIILNRNKRLKIRGYDPGELQTGLEARPNYYASDATTDSTAEDVVSTPGVKRLKEVEVVADNLSHEREIGLLKENSVASYDIADEYDALQDEGVTSIRYLTDLLPMINDKFRINHNTLTYADKRPLFVLDEAIPDNATALTLSGLDRISALDVPIEAVSTLYINEQPTVIADYALQYTRQYDFHSRMEADRHFGCVVFVELFPEKMVEVGPGMRRTRLEAYSPHIEYYSPDYEGVPPIDTDRRRTLYWNPDVRPDYDGVARVRFFNNSTARNFHVTTATVSPLGQLGGQ